MKTEKLSNQFLSAFSMELALMLRSGMSVNDGLYLMAGEESEGAASELLRALAEQMDAGKPLSQALAETGSFPGYMVQMVLTGERSGRPEEALVALSSYYDSRSRLSERIRTALLYPVILAVLMLAVICVLVVKVLPVFDQVYRQLGSSLSGIGGGLLRFGQALSGALPVILVILAALVLVGAAAALIPDFRAALTRGFRKRRGAKGLSGKIAGARFASAMAMGMASGLPVEESLELAASFQKDNPDMLRRVEECSRALDGGAPLAEALGGTGLFSPVYCRMIGLGIRSGAGDSVMSEVARRMETDAEEAIERAVGRVEPALVIASSILVGIVILAVMIPLMNVMSVIG